LSRQWGPLYFTYFIAGYFYEIESALIQNDYVQFLCQLGGAKGKVTRYFLLKGLEKILIKQTVDEWLNQTRCPPDFLEKAGGIFGFQGNL